MPKLICPLCGELEPLAVEPYHDALRKQTFGISPVLPTCKLCRSEIAVYGRCGGGDLILLNGTCGSGKSTVAEALAAHYGFLVIDGDCAMQSAKHRRGGRKVEFNSAEMLEEIGREIDLLSLYGKKMVLSHIVLPEDVDSYQKIFDERNLRYCFVLLKPEYDAAVQRCQTRTCHNNITPEFWVRHFYDALRFADGQVITIDNTELSAEQTAAAALRSLGSLPGSQLPAYRSIQHFAENNTATNQNANRPRNQRKRQPSG